ncbi:hypothetical protein A6A03_00245 [Chloroflexus islandicus]|uniref:Uncharacterized protein n=1 Tax=Chloroflexus islandicus TaxID=1707952 RepID=A0A178MEL0_9CHLR|nr:hypothetical protein [Chloroflexus islandicus]OAN47211.1 hypothetical protein A6A03_00245 [Chloroflexus islandicus]
MFFCLDHIYHPPAGNTAITYQRESENPVEYRLVVANQILYIIFDGGKRWSGHVVRPSDGIEASFSSRNCLEYVIEGLIGRRVWPQYRQQVVALLDQFQV